MRRTLMLLIVLLGASLVPAARAADPISTNVDVVMIIDHSGSMQDNDPRGMRVSAARLFAQLAAKGDQIGVVSMGDKTSTKTMLSLSVVDQVAQFRWDTLNTFDPPPELASWTYMGEAFDVAATVMDNAPKHNPKRAVIFLTDGKATYEDQDIAEQEHKLDAAVERLHAAGVKIFPIALGDGPDQAALQTRLVDPTGGRLWVAPNADQLTEIFVGILASLQDGRYVDQYTVVANTETFLANVSPRQQIEQINFVLPRQHDDPPTIEHLLLPDTPNGGVDNMSRFQDPNWSLFTARPAYVPRINGEWRAQIAAGQAQVPVIAVIKSGLRARLLDPLPSTPDDETSLRYHPAGKPLLLRAGARNPSDRLEKRLGVNVQLGSQSVLLADDGHGPDLAPDDGMYSGLTEPLPPGTLRVAVNLSPSDSHLFLAKPYDVVVEPLPVMQVELAPQHPVQPNEPVQVNVRWTLDQQPVTVDDAEITAVVKRDNQVIGTLPLHRDGTTWEGSYQPDMAGPITFGLTAHATWNAPDRGMRRYTDYAEAPYTVALQPLVDVRVDNTVEHVNDLAQGIQRTVSFASQSDRAVNLQLGVQGVPDATVYPATITVAPYERGSRTVTIRSATALHSGSWSAYLTVDGGGDVRLNTSDVPVTFTVNAAWTRYRVPLLVLSAVLGLLARRKTRRSLADLVTRNVELLRYGGR